MTPEVKRQWKETLARLRHERGAYAKRATTNRKLATEYRKNRDWLGATQADDRASEYRKTRDQYAAEIKKIVSQTGLR